MRRGARSVKLTANYERDGAGPALRRAPADEATGFTAVALATLTLGIGAATSIFSVVDAVVFKPLPFRDPDRVLAIWEKNPRRTGSASQLRWAIFTNGAAGADARRRRWDLRRARQPDGRAEWARRSGRVESGARLGIHCSRCSGVQPYWGARFGRKKTGRATPTSPC